MEKTNEVFVRQEEKPEVEAMQAFLKTLSTDEQRQLYIFMTGYRAGQQSCREMGKSA